MIIHHIQEILSRHHTAMRIYITLDFMRRIPLRNNITFIKTLTLIEILERLSKSFFTLFFRQVINKILPKFS